MPPEMGAFFITGFSAHLDVLKPPLDHGIQKASF